MEHTYIQYKAGGAFNIHNNDNTGDLHPARNQSTYKEMQARRDDDNGAATSQRRSASTAAQQDLLVSEGDEDE